MTWPRVLPFGDRGLLLEVETLAEVLALHARLARSRPEGVIDLVPAARTVLVHVDPRRLPLAAARSWALRADGEGDAEASPAPLVELPVVYDGADLNDLAAHLGVAPEELIARHAACEWTVAFTGFAPGFGYLVSADWPYDVPRLASPRTRVPAGAIGLAGAFSGAYPRETPGGWQLIGTTPATLFDVDASPPALLAPGTRVRFRRGAPAPSAAAAPTSPRPTSAREADPGTVGLAADGRSRDDGAPPALTVVDPGPRATIQDQGRPGHAAEGVASSGAADRGALRTANRLVGNPEDAAGIEITMGGFRAIAERDLDVVVTGAWGPIIAGGQAADPYTVMRLARGAELHIDAATHGTRAYLAVRGGLAGRTVAGSRATDTMSGIGPAPLAPGAVLALADPHPALPIPPDDVRPWSPPGEVLDLELAPGPRADWFADADSLFEREWTVSAAADRVGIRLSGVPLRRAGDPQPSRELPTEGMLPGAMQVPPDGLPVILGPDGPVTGGYPVVAVVTDASRDALAQARPGTRLRCRHAR